MRTHSHFSLSTVFINSASVLHSNAEKNAEKIECVSCWDAAPDTVILECGHVCLCRACAPAAKACPLCRKPVVRVVVQRK